MSKSPIFMGSMIVFIICLVISMYYFIPMSSHLFDSHGGAKHGIAFLAVAVVALLVALSNRSKGETPTTTAPTV